MNYAKLLTRAGVPVELHQAAIASLSSAKKRAKGLVWAKWKVRLFKADQIAKTLEWSDERLVDVTPDRGDWDIAPMLNITAHGDNVPWNPATSRPAVGAWLSDDQDSPEFQAAVKDCYWSKGNHPRSRQARKAWYRRNAGEYRAWRLGAPVDLAAQQPQVWQGEGVTVYRCGDAWLINAKRFLVDIRIGYEIDNLWREDGNIQLWYPIPGHDLRAPLTWSLFS